MTLSTDGEQLVGRIKDGRMTSTAYDTSWFLRLREGDSFAFPSALEWVRRHQHADGSWGGTFETYHDRLISTLAVVNALTLNKPYLPSDFAPMIERGLAYVTTNAHKLSTDEYETIGFELLFPMLLNEAATLGIELPYEAFQSVSEVQQAKLRLLPPNWVYQRGSPAAHNLEFLGSGLDVNKATTLIDSAGSVCNSPSASAYLAQFLNHNSLRRYLHTVIDTSLDGGACNVSPFELFETGWVYYNLLLADIRVPQMVEGVRQLQDAFGSMGLGISRVGLIPDADDSALAMKVLSLNHIAVPLDYLNAYESPQGFRCFPFERNPSVSTNIHILDALAGLETAKAAEFRSHIRDFLADTRIDQAYWKDKWHASPYYATNHAILALRGVDQQLVDDALAWVYETQRDDGSWGLFGGTVEETAYSLQAVLLADPQALDTHRDALKRAADYLKSARGQSHYPELWIGKGLYAPIHVIESGCISALALFERKAVATS